MTADGLFSKDRLRADEATPPNIRLIALYRGQTLGVSNGLRVVVTVSPSERGELRCGVITLTPQRPPPCNPSSVVEGTIRPGDQFADPVSGLEVTCTHVGYGVLSFNGRKLLRHTRARPT
jgi:hypothetical protein